MLRNFMEDSYEIVKASNQPMFRTDIDYGAEERKKSDLIAEWKAMKIEEQAVFKSQPNFLNSRGLIDLSSQKMTPVRNYHLLSREATSRVGSANDLQLLAIDGLNFDNSIMELAKNIENIEDIRDLYRLRKKTAGRDPSSGINAAEASGLKSCFSQGRELYISGKNGSLMVKPLNLFYALTAYTYGIIVLNNPIRFSKRNLPGSHGLSVNLDPVFVQFGGDSARGTFSDLVTSFPTHMLKTPGTEFQIDCRDSVVDFHNTRFTSSMGTLLSMVPELSEYYRLTTGRPSRCHPLSIVTENDPRTLRWEFQIGNGETRPSDQAIRDAFPNLQAKERYGKVTISISAIDSSRIKACIYCDIRGNMWFIENPFFPVAIPEIAIHFLINSIFSNIMRYSPDEWANIILNDTLSGISLITRHYYSSFQRKFFLLILRCLSRYFPYVA